VRLSPTSDVWWKNAVIYCLDVETFNDADGDGCGDLAGLIERIDHFAHFLYLGGEAVIGLLGWRACSEQHARIAASPAAIVERECQITGFGECSGLRLEHRGGATPTMRQYDGRQRCVRALRVVQRAVHAYAVAHDVDRALFDRCVVGTRRHSGEQEQRHGQNQS